MPWSRYLVRLAVALGSFTIVSLGLVAGAAAIAMNMDWEIPEETELHGPSSLFDRTGRPLYRFASDVERRIVPLDAISPRLQQAVVAAEDHRFYEHQGVDPLSVVRAVVSNVRHGGIREGGSTLTQQYVKNVYVGSDRTAYRKVREAVISLQLEKERTKEEILEGYLNRVYFGDGAYGAQAAAQTYFGKPAADLDVAEAATLAAVLVSPSRLSPRVNPDLTEQRRNRILDRMLHLDFANIAEVDSAKARPIEVVPRERHMPAAPYYVEEIRKQLLDDPNVGADKLYHGGLVIHAAISIEDQFALEREVIEHLPPDERFDFGVAVVEPATGDVLAAWSGRDFRQSQVDLALRRSSGRQSGSTFKVFALAAALEEGKTLSTTYPAPQQVRISSVWRPRGGGGCGSPCPLLEATVRSSNTVFAQLARDIGVESFVGMARRLGVRSQLNDDPGELAQVLGTSNVTPLDMASAFATLANDGVACPARLVTEVKTPDGAAVPVTNPRQPSEEQIAQWQERFDELGYDFGEEEIAEGCYRALAPSVARTVTQALEQAVVRGTGRNAVIDRPVAGKTGTTQLNQMAWFAGYTRHRSIAVALGARDADIPLTEIPGCGRACFGGQLPASVWADVAVALHGDLPPEPFLEPGADERVVPDRRQLGPPTRRPAPPEPQPEAIAEPDDEPTAGPTEQPPSDEDGDPDAPPQEEPSPGPGDDGGDGGDDGGILGPIFGGDDDDGDGGGGGG